ncbi:putative inorganic carbon transporter subunit DabA [Candidatus Accumulibacter sp. ACC003]|uniref:putative inorganic carbon transporter subunit DabA n=1 Tax=Candidatus Accumulibacter sp. ACC003 TaxID=2823334 RepID=UPI0025BDBCE7|nr:putative inorganic carbon transporter subunit DabA [Candidatus Accumulibacter sp. ACC003]
MTTPATLPTALAREPASDLLAQIKVWLAHLEHLLPAQAPLRDFVHHNTLHAFQQLPFAEACSAAARLTGARPWLAEDRCRRLFRQGRVTTADLDDALRQLAELRAEQPLCATASRELCRGEVLQVALRYSPNELSAAQLRWQIDEQAAFARWSAELDEATQQRLARSAAADGLDEHAAVADLWAAACQLQPPAALVPERAKPTADGLAGVTADGPRPQAAAALWKRMVDGLGERWTVADLLAHLSGEDLRTALQPTLIRHLGAHLDQGLAAWPNPAREQGFYAAWRASASDDLAWELDEFADARGELERLPDEPLPLIADELRRLGIAPTKSAAYLQRLALELPGWAGMFQWREAHPRAGQAPVTLADLLAVRLLLERLHAEQLLRRIWGLPLSWSALADYFAAQPAELCVRHACGSGHVSEELRELLSPHLAARAANAGADWRQFAARLADSLAHAAAAPDRQALAAWPLFILAQRLALGGRELREIGAVGAAALLRCAASLTPEQRGQLWLLAYEGHYRQQILAALAANHRRRSATSRPPAAQFVFCMDDREEGSRRHLEEVNPAFETFGAAGFFGVPMLWQGIDDEAPSALCPIVVRPTNALREQAPAGTEAAHRLHRRRRQRRLDWQETLHQGSRRGWLQASLLSAVAGPAALLALLARTLAPGRFAALLERYRDAFDRPVPGQATLTATPAEAARVASAEAPRLGFSEDEQLARVGGFLRSIGLTTNFAPLVLIVGHGSDSRNNVHLAAYDCGACSGRHGGPNARVFAALANRPQVRARLAEQGLAIPATTHFVGGEHNTCDETYIWYDLEQLPASHQQAFAALRADCAHAAGLHAVERCRRFASAPRNPSPQQAQQHLADRRHDFAQARPELGHATVATAFIGRRTMSRGAFFDRRVFLISYDPLPDVDGRILEATLLAAGPVGAGINLEYYFSTVDNEGFGCGSKVMHNLAGLFGVMQGTSSDLRTGLPLQMIEIHEPMRLLVVVEQTLELLSAIYQRQPPLQELIGNGWLLVVAKHPASGAMHVFEPARGWQPWNDAADAPLPALAEVERSVDWFAGHRDALPPALLRRPLVNG